MTPEEAIALISDGGLLKHKWIEFQEDGEWVAKHDPECEWCKAVAVLEWVVEQRRREQNEADLNRSW